MSLWQLFTWPFIFPNINTISCSFTVSNQMKALYNKRSALITWRFRIIQYTVLLLCENRSIAQLEIDWQPSTITKRQRCANANGLTCISVDQVRPNSKISQIARIVNFSDSYYRPQRSCGKVMFLHVSAILSVDGVVWQADTPLAGRSPCQADTTPRHDHCTGRYASYWNVFLCIELYC